MDVVFGPLVGRLGSCSIAGLSGPLDYGDCKSLIPDVHVFVTNLRLRKEKRQLLRQRIFRPK